MNPLPIVYNHSIPSFIFVILQKITIGFWVGFTVTFVIGLLLKPLASQNILIFSLLGTLCSCWLIHLTCKEWFWKFRLDDDQISLQKFNGHSIMIKRGEIQKIEWQNARVTIFGQNEAISFNMRMFSGKQFVQILYLLPRWVPLNILRPEEQQALDEELHWFSHLTSQPSGSSSSKGFKHLLKDRDNIMIVIIQILALDGFQGAVPSGYGYPPVGAWI